jgi:hypothetical protein
LTQYGKLSRLVSVLDRVSINQTRLNIPGITPDPRGVMLGQRGLLLFPTIERLVSYFRVYGDQDSIDELLPTIKIRQVKTPLGTREFVVSFAVASSYQMDRCAGITKMLGGLAFTGTSRHFVKYRDASSPLGFDADRLLPSGGDLALYHDDFSQVYDEEREIVFKQLLLQLSPQRIAIEEGSFPDEIVMAVRPGLAGAVQGYLFRNGANAEVALAEWPSRSAFDEGSKRLFLFRCTDLPRRIPALMAATPGIAVYEPVGPNVAVEHGYRHPIHLPSCLSVFHEGGLYLFSGSRDTVDIVAPVPEFAHVKHLSTLAIDLGRDSAPSGHGARSASEIHVPLRLVPAGGPWRRVRAVSIPWSRADWLQRLVYALPPRLLAETKVHFSDARILILGEAGVESIPLGTLLCAVGDNLLVAAGYGFLPSVSPELLAELIGLGQGELGVFEPGLDQPYIVRESDFQPLGRGAVATVLASRVDSLTTENPRAESPTIEYDQLGPFPLWGLPGRRTTGDKR